MFQKGLAASVVVILLVCAPLALSAQEKEDRGAEQASVLGWLSGIWGDLTTWLAGEAAPEGSAGTHGEGGCWIDPDGCPQGG